MTTASQPLPKHHDGYTNSLLRGMAIIAVVTLHILANLHQEYSPTNPSWQLAVALDQFCRFSVPFFVALSGFSFWQKYQHVAFRPIHFWRTQVMKLIPFYVVASALTYLIFTLIPQWQAPNVSRSFVVQILSGKADYHLYFVPMIFQLYLLFPVMYFFVKKLPWISLALAAAFQIWLYTLYSMAIPTPFIAAHFATDQQQYIWFFSWVFYMILGMHLPRIIRYLEQQRRAALLILGSFLVTWGWLVHRAITDLNLHVDPIIALRFTHLDTLLYASSAAIVFMFFAEHAKRKMRRLTSPLSWLGKYSYYIYLFHYLVIRVVFFVL